MWKKLQDCTQTALSEVITISHLTLTRIIQAETNPTPLLSPNGGSRVEVVTW
jgi:hypothetical protein